MEGFEPGCSRSNYISRYDLLDVPEDNFSGLYQYTMANGYREGTHLKYKGSEKLQWLHFNSKALTYFILTEHQTVLEKSTILLENNPITIDHHRNQHFFDDKEDKESKSKTLLDRNNGARLLLIYPLNMNTIDTLNHNVLAYILVHKCNSNLQCYGVNKFLD